MYLDNNDTFENFMKHYNLSKKECNTTKAKCEYLTELEKKTKESSKEYTELLESSKRNLDTSLYAIYINPLINFYNSILFYNKCNLIKPLNIGATLEDLQTINEDIFKNTNYLEIQ